MEEDERFLRACEENQLEEAQAALAGGANVRSVHGDGFRNAVVLACSGPESSRAELLEWLLSCEQWVRTCEKSPVRDEWSVEAGLRHAAEACNVAVVRLLLAHGLDARTRDDENWPLLAAAVCGGSVRVVKEILASTGGEGLEDAPENGVTALMVAAAHGRKEQSRVFRYLLACGANVRARDARGCTPLLLAAKRGNEAMVEAILASVEGRSTIEMIVTSSGETELMDAYLRHWQGDTPLLVAADGGHLESLRLLLKHGANVRAQNFYGHTALATASCKGYTALVEEILTHKEGRLTIEVAGNFARTPLLLAAGELHVEAYLLLRAYGANEGVRDTEGKTPLHRACMRIFEDIRSIVAAILGSEAGRSMVDVADDSLGTPLMYAARGGNVAAARLLLVNGANVARRNKEGRSALAMACEQGYPHMVQLLLEEAAGRVAMNKHDKQGTTPLMEAAWDAPSTFARRFPNAPPRDRLAVVRILLASGVDLYADIKRSTRFKRLLGYTSCRQARSLIIGRRLFGL